MSDTELHKFAQILSVRLNSLTDKKALHIYRTLIPSDSFRNNVPLLYLDYINLNGRYLQVLSLVEELGANPSDLFFVDLMKFYNQFYTQKNIDVPHPSKPSQFDQFYSVLKGRYYGGCLLSANQIDSGIREEILKECENLPVSYFLLEIIPALILIEAFEFLDELFELYYEDIFEFGVWSSSTTQSVYLIGLAYVNLRKNEIKTARKNLDFVNIERVELGYEKYILLFYYLVDLKITFEAKAIIKNRFAQKKMMKLVKETGFKRFELLSSSYCLD